MNIPKSGPIARSVSISVSVLVFLAASFLASLVVIYSARPFDTIVPVGQTLSDSTILLMRVLWIGLFAVLFVALDLGLRRRRGHALAFLAGFGSYWALNALTIIAAGGHPYVMLPVVAGFFALASAVVYADLRRTAAQLVSETTAA